MSVAGCELILASFNLLADLCEWILVNFSCKLILVRLMLIFMGEYLRVDILEFRDVS